MSSINKSTRKVKRRSKTLNLSSGKTKYSKKPSRDSVKIAAKKLSRTKTRQYVLFALGAFVIMQIISYVTTDSPIADLIPSGGLVFLLVIYLQFGLMLALVGFLMAASVTYLRSLND